MHEHGDVAKSAARSTKSYKNSILYYDLVIVVGPVDLWKTIVSEHSC